MGIATPIPVPLASSYLLGTRKVTSWKKPRKRAGPQGNTRSLSRPQQAARGWGPGWGWGGGSALAPRAAGLKGPVAPSGPAELWPPLSSHRPQVGTEDPHHGGADGGASRFAKHSIQGRLWQVDRQTHRHRLQRHTNMEALGRRSSSLLTPTAQNSPLPDPAETGSGVGSTARPHCSSHSLACKVWHTAAWTQSPASVPRRSATLGAF